MSDLDPMAVKFEWRLNKFPFNCFNFFGLPPKRCYWGYFARSSWLAVLVPHAQFTGAFRIPLIRWVGSFAKKKYILHLQIFHKHRYVYANVIIPSFPGAAAACSSSFLNTSFDSSPPREIQLPPPAAPEVTPAEGSLLPSFSTCLFDP